MVKSITINDEGNQVTVYEDGHTFEKQPLSYSQKERAVKILDGFIAKDDYERLRQEMEKDPSGWLTPYHMWAGMAVRNHLRSGGFRDDELPFVYYNGQPVQNWDDYYGQIIEILVGFKPIEKAF